MTTNSRYFFFSELSRICFRKIDFSSFYGCDNWFWNCSDSKVVFLFCFIIVRNNFDIYVFIKELWKQRLVVQNQDIASEWTAVSVS